MKLLEYRKLSGWCSRCYRTYLQDDDDQCPECGANYAGAKITRPVSLDYYLTGRVGYDAFEDIRNAEDQRVLEALLETTP
jgi:hypothetical protein